MLLTLEDLRSRVYSRLDGNTQLYPLSEVDHAINETIQVTNAVLGYNQGKVNLDGGSIPNRVYYDVPYSVLFPMRLQFEQRYLEPISIKDIGRSYPTWTTDTTSVSGYPVTLWVPLGIRKFALWPADSFGGGQIAITGILEPTPLVNPTDQVNWTKDIVAAFDLYATHVLQLKESPQIFKQASNDYQEYQKIVRRVTYLKDYRSPRYWNTEVAQKVNK